MNTILNNRAGIAVIKAVAVVAGVLATAALENRGAPGMAAVVASAAFLVFATPRVVMAGALSRASRTS